MAATDERPSISSTAWLGVGVLGLVLFVIGIYTPPYLGISNPTIQELVQILVAIAGGAAAMYGFSRWWDERKAERERAKKRPISKREKELSFAPSYEVYDPKNAVEAPHPPEPPPYRPPE